MPYEWYVALWGRTHGPITLEALLNILEREGTPKTLVWHPSLPRWTRVRDRDDVVLALTERFDAAARPPGRVPLTVLPPPPGEPWFFPMSSVAVGLLNLLTLGLYTFVWRYQHRAWALRRAGRPTAPFGAVFHDEFHLDVQLARAAIENRVRGTSPDTRLTPCQKGVYLFVTVLCPYVLLLAWLHVTICDAALQRAANRVNRAVAPGRRAPLLGWLEVATLIAIPVGLVSAIAGLLVLALVA